MRQAEENVEAEIVDRLEIPLHAYEIGKLKKKKIMVTQFCQGYTESAHIIMKEHSYFTESNL